MRARARIARMSDALPKIACQRCGSQMEMKDPAPGAPWTPDQYWVCPACGRHFWSTYPPPAVKKDAAPAASGS